MSKVKLTLEQFRLVLLLAFGSHKMDKIVLDPEENFRQDGSRSRRRKKKEPKKYANEDYVRAKHNLPPRELYSEEGITNMFSELKGMNNEKTI